MEFAIVTIVFLYMIISGLIAGFWYHNIFIKWIEIKREEFVNSNTTGIIDFPNTVASVVAGIITYSIVSEVIAEIERENSLWYKIKKCLFGLKNNEDEDINNEENALKEDNKGEV